jgi:hypothetical protein
MDCARAGCPTPESATSGASEEKRLFTDTITVADERQTNTAAGAFAPALPEHHIVTCDPNHTRRAEAEAFVSERFLRRHGARISSFMPTLLLLIDSDGDLCAVAGFRHALREPLFLERYLSAPIEQTISLRLGAPVPRAQVVEVGNFAALDSRRARILMSFMPAYFLEHESRWIVFTATTLIRGLVSALGGHCLEVGTADGACVAGGVDEWGRYYSSDPRVMAGYLPSARSIPALWRSHHGD